MEEGKEIFQHVTACVIVIAAWQERASEKGTMTNQDRGECRGIHGRGIKLSRHWERHCDGHKPPDPLLGACAQLR